MARKHEFCVDMHVHSMYSGESAAEPRDIVEAALAKGLDAICVTEHESLSASAPFEDLRRSSGLIILRGVELSTDAGHMLVYGVNDHEWRDWGRSKVCHAQELTDRVRRLGGVVVPAHPYVISCSSGGAPFWWDPLIEVDERVKSVRGIAALEVCNGKHLNYPAICEALGRLAKGLGLPGTGGSDAHAAEDVGRCFTVFHTPIHSGMDLVDAIRRGLLHPENLIGVRYNGGRAAYISAR